MPTTHDPALAPGQAAETRGADAGYADAGPERGWHSAVRRTVGRRAGRVAEAAVTPLVPADYLDLVAPMRSGADLRGRVEAVHPETRDAATLVIRPGADWAGHQPGQYVRIGVDVDGVRHWRAYSLTHGPRRDGRIAVTVKAMADGTVSPHLVHRTQPGTMLHLEQAAGEFLLPPSGDKLLFVTAGSGITPVIGMLRNLFPSTDDGVLHPHRSEAHDIVVVHVAPSRPETIFGRDLEALASAGAIRLVSRYDDEHGVLDVDDLADLVPDLGDRRTFACGPPGLLDALEAHHERAGLALTTEQFRPVRLAGGEGGTVSFSSGTEVEADGSTPILDAAEEAGMLMPSGCRMGICMGCVLPMRSGAVRDLRTGEVTTADPRRDQRRWPAGADLHQRRRRRVRDRPLTRPAPTGHPAPTPPRGATMTTTTRKPENPVDHLSDADVEAIGEELDAIRQSVIATRGERDATYIRRVVKAQRWLEVGSRTVLLASVFPPAWLAGTAGLSIAKIIENMEIGHNVMHGQWDWMRDPKIHSTTWEWDNASPSEGWKHSHNQVHHTHTNIVGMDNDLGYGIMRVDEDQRWHPMYLGQPVWNFVNACIFEYGIAAYDLELGKNLRVPKEKRDPAFVSSAATTLPRSAGRRPRTTWSTRCSRCPPARSCRRWPRTRSRTWRGTCGRTRSSCAATSPRASRRSSARRSRRTRPAASGTCGRCSAPRTSPARRPCTS